MGNFNFIFTGLYKIQSCVLHFYVPGLGPTIYSIYKILSVFTKYTKAGVYEEQGEISEGGGV